MKRQCEYCCTPLKDYETITCDPCHAKGIRELLASDVWMEVRGPYMADALMDELVATEARMLGWEG